VLDVVRTGGATNFYVDRAVESLDERGRPAEFTLALAAKDAGLIADLAAASGIPAPVARAVRDALDRAVDRGLGDRDWSDLVVAAEADAGLELVLGPPREST
jgi:3-hydroxyisobutyrate dehydrogenase